MSNYQKSFGQSYIQDDRFFAVVATIQNVGNGLSRIMGGLLYDKMGFQVKRWELWHWIGYMWSITTSLGVQLFF